jgi:hypothetical protein
VLAALGIYTQAGRAIYDLNKQVYRVRELSREPLPMDKLRFANEREQAANRLVSDETVTVRSVDADQGGAAPACAAASRTARAPTSPSWSIDRDSGSPAPPAPATSTRKISCTKAPVSIYWRCGSSTAARRGADFTDLRS